MQPLQIQALEMEIESDEQIFNHGMEVKICFRYSNHDVTSMMHCTMMQLFFLSCIVLCRSSALNGQFLQLLPPHVVLTIVPSSPQHHTNSTLLPQLALSCWTCRLVWIWQEELEWGQWQLYCHVCRLISRLVVIVSCNSTSSHCLMLTICKCGVEEKVWGCFYHVNINVILGIYMVKWDLDCAS